MGIMVVFKGLAFRSPIVFLNAAAFGGAMIIYATLQRKRKEASRKGTANI
jgi:hypothetical protein